PRHERSTAAITSPCLVLLTCAGQDAYSAELPFVGGPVVTVPQHVTPLASLAPLPASWRPPTRHRPGHLRRRHPQCDSFTPIRSGDVESTCRPGGTCFCHWRKYVFIRMWVTG